MMLFRIWWGRRGAPGYIEIVFLSDGSDVDEQAMAFGRLFGRTPTGSERA